MRDVGRRLRGAGGQQQQQQRWTAKSSRVPTPNQPLRASPSVVCKEERVRVTGCDRGVRGEEQWLFALPHTLLLDWPPQDSHSVSLLPTTATSSPGPSSSRAAQLEHPSGEQSLHGSGLVPLLLWPLAALVPRGQVFLSLSKEENSKVVG